MQPTANAESIFPSVTYYNASKIVKIFTQLVKYTLRLVLEYTGRVITSYINPFSIDNK